VLLPVPRTLRRIPAGSITRSGPSRRLAWQARDHVDAATGRERHDDADRPAGFENIEALLQRFTVMAPDVQKVKAFIAEHTGL
jgi:hypothetical protein